MDRSAETTSQSGVSTRNYTKSGCPKVNEYAGAAVLESNGVIILPQMQICPPKVHICPCYKNAGAIRPACMHTHSNRIESTLPQGPARM